MKYFRRLKNVLDDAISILVLRVLSWQKNISLGNGVRLAGMPIIDIHKNARLVIGDQVTLTSRNRGYHLNLFAPTKLFADCDNAKIHIGSYTRIHGSCIHAFKEITIGSNVLIAANCQIIDANGHALSFNDVNNRINTVGESKKVVIEDGVWLATGVIVLPGVTIGKGSIISANSVVVNDIPPMVVAGGNPARVIRRVES